MLYLLCGWAAGLAAQEEESVSFDFRVFRVGNADVEGVQYLPSPIEEPRELSFLRYRRSPVTYEYRGPNPVTFFRTVPDPTPEDPAATRREPVGQLAIDPSIKEALVFFITNRLHGRAPNEPEMYVMAMDDSESGFPPETMIIFNATGARLASRIAGNDSWLGYGPSRAFSMRKFIEEAVPVAFAIESREGPLIVYENDFRFTSDERVIMLLEPPRRPRSIRIQTRLIVDSPAREAANEAAAREF